MPSYLGNLSDVHGHGGENDADGEPGKHPSPVERGQAGYEADHDPGDGQQYHAEEYCVLSANPVQQRSGEYGPDGSAQRDQGTDPAGFILGDLVHAGGLITFLQLHQGRRRPRHGASCGERTHVHCRPDTKPSLVYYVHHFFFFFFVYLIYLIVPTRRSIFTMLSFYKFMFTMITIITIIYTFLDIYQKVLR